MSISDIIMLLNIALAIKKWKEKHSIFYNFDSSPLSHSLGLFTTWIEEKDVYDLWP